MSAAALAGLLRRPRFEVLPLDGIEEEVLAHLATDTRLTAAGVREIFVPAGDAAEPGAFHGAVDLLTAMGPLRERFDGIGITGYPESHHLISDEETIQAMFAKAPMATCIISQICFDAGVIGGWVREVRRRGVQLPIWVGMPGAVDHAKLLRISMTIGLGGSARFLAHHRGWVSRLLTRRFRPDALLRGLAPLAADPAAGIAGLHLYTFNEVARTERWRRSALARAEENSSAAASSQVAT